MQDALIEEDGLSPERKSVLPDPGFFVPESVRSARKEDAVTVGLAGAETVVVADPDADGLACAALVFEAHGDGVLVPTRPHEVSRGLELVAEGLPAGAGVYVCDLCPDPGDDIVPLVDALVSRGRFVRWFDHHQWDSALAEAVRSAGAELAVGESDKECSADVAFRELDEALPERFGDLVAVTRDHDLWIRADPRSDDLADFAYWADPDEYVEVVREHGADLPGPVRERLAARRVEKDDLIARAVRRASFHEIAGIRVGVTYGRCSQNEVAEALRQDGADAAVIVKPTGSVSLRGSAGFERCHEVAGLINGGGHPRAAGCKPEVYRDMLDYAYHWTTHGAVAREVVLDAFRAVLEPSDEGLAG